MSIVDYTNILGFVIPALRQAQDKLTYGQTGVQFNKNAGFRVKPGMTALFIFLLFAALALPCSAYAEKNILVFGDSLSAGYGIAVEKSWVSLMKQDLKGSHPKYSIVNASISGETTAGGRQRIAKTLKQHRPSILIVELGANDGLRGIPIKDIEANLDFIIWQAKNAGAKVLLAGMRLPPNYGETYVTQFQNIYPRLAKQHRIRLLPFLLDGVPPGQFQADNLHPSAEAQPHIMRTVLLELKHLLH